MAGLQGEEGAALLDIVDELRSLSIVRDEIPLPQIVVVGDQSVGKSSVLEAISGFKFPKDSIVCTQFATEVSLRRNPEHSSEVGITTESNIPDQQEKINQFTRRWANKEFETEKANKQNAKQLETFVKEAAEVMNFQEGSHFSQDILKVTISGPEKDHLTLVDLPGLIAVAPTKEWDKDPNWQRDPDLVNQLVNSYIKGKRTIVLAVVRGSSELETQRILAMLRKIDGWEDRTLGIITAPDEVHTVGGPQKTSQLTDFVRGKKMRLKLGWHVLRNPSWEERQKEDFDRDDNEKTFFNSPGFWSTLPAEWKGATNLKKRLQRLLMDHISNELPDILEAVQKEIDACDKELKTLGEGRPTVQDQKEYLEDIAEKFSSLTKSAVDGNWEDTFFNAEKHRLRALIGMANDDFAEAMTRCGHRWQIIHSNAKPAQKSRVQMKSHLRCPAPEQITQEAMEEKVGKMYPSYRGPQLHGTDSPVLISKLFRDQANSWRSIAKQHVDYVFRIVQSFMFSVFEDAAGADMALKIWHHMVKDSMEKRGQALQQKLEEILQPYEKKHPQTLNPLFRTSLRMAADIDNFEADADVELGASDYGVTQSRGRHLQSRQQLSQLNPADRTIRLMRSFYNIALAVFIDNVAILAIEQCLLDDLHNIVSTKLVSRMPNQKISQIACESRATIERRNDLKMRFDEYCNAKDAIMRHSSNFQLLPHSVIGLDTPDNAFSDEASTFTDEETAANPDIPSMQVNEPNPRWSSTARSIAHQEMLSSRQAAAIFSRVTQNVNEKSSKPDVSPDDSFTHSTTLASPRHVQGNLTPPSTGERDGARATVTPEKSPTPPDRHHRADSRNANLSSYLDPASNDNVPTPRRSPSRAEQRLGNYIRPSTSATKNVRRTLEEHEKLQQGLEEEL